MKKAGKQGSSLASTLKDGVGGAATFVANKVSASTIALGNLMADAVKATAGAAKNLVQDVFEEYANTEQLYGGVETIFKDSAEAVKKNASEAFMTAGMSANEYMQTVTSFSSSLLQGLDGDTKKAAEVADMAIRDMSDNANKFGTDMGLIQNAYQGFAKDNFTMLDNLKLGYGGTQAEMARLINDSGVLGKKIVTAANVSEVPLDKMFEAIHIIQQEMNITGTTAAEAADTISGSFAAFKATWRNLLSGLADEKDVDQLVDNLFESGENLLGNIARLVPRIGENTVKAFDAFLENFDFYKKLKGAYKEDGIAGVVGTIKTDLKKELEKLGPIAIDTGADLIAGIYTGLTGDTTSKEEVKAYFSGLWADVVATKNTVVAGAQSILGEIYAALTGDTANNASIKGVFDALWADVSEAGNVVVDTASGLLGDIYEGFTGQEATKENIVNTIKGLFTSGSEEMETFKTNATGLLSGIASAITGDEATIDSVGEALGKIFAAGNEAVESLKSAAGGLLGAIYTTFTGQEATADNIGKTIGGLFNAGVDAANDVMSTAATFFNDLAAALGDPDASIGQKIAGVFETGGEAMLHLINDAGNFMANLYAAITGDEESAQKIREWVDNMFATPEEINAKNKEAAKTYSAYHGLDSHQTVMGYASSMFASPMEYGISESQADEWITALSKGASYEGYAEVVRAVMDAWNSKQQETEDRDDGGKDEEAALAPAVEAITQAANAITQAASTPAPVNVEVNASIDGQQVAAIVTPTVSRGINRAIMQARFA